MFFRLPLVLYEKEDVEREPPTLFLTQLVLNENGDVWGDPPTPLFNPNGV